MTPETKVCSRCGEEKALADFYASPRGRLGVKATCRVCDIAKAKAWAADNKEKVRQIKSEYKSRNKDKAKAYYEKTKDVARARSASRFNRMRKQRLAQMRKWKQRLPLEVRRARARDQARKHAAALTDGYVRSQLIKRTAISRAVVTKEMLDLKREQLTYHRIARSIRSTVKE